MKLNIFHHRELLILGIALGFLFFGWNAAEQHLTSFYQTTEGQTATGLNALAILYGSIILGSFVGPIFTRRLGLKLSIIFSFLTYTLLVFGVVSKITPVIYLLSALLGIGAGIMSVAQIDLIRIFSPANLRGELTGSVNTLRTIGGGLGVLSVSFFLQILKIEQVYLGLGSVMILGCITLLFLKTSKESRPEQKEKISKIIKKTINMLKETKLLLTVPICVANGFLLGLVLGAIPTSITQTLGLTYVGLTMSFFHFTLSFSGFFSGKISDKIGRFPILYLSTATGIASAVLVILSHNIFPIIIAMVLAGFFSATNGVLISVLFIDIFTQKAKEAQAASGIIGTFLGIVPAFILNKYFSPTQLLFLAIFLCAVGGLSLGFLEFKQKGSLSFQHP